MYKLVKTVGNKWYVRFFLVTDAPTDKLVINASPNVQFAVEKGCPVDGNWTEGYSVEGGTLTFGKKGTSFTVSANNTNGETMTLDDNIITPDSIIDPSPKPRTDTPPRPEPSPDVVVMDSHPIESWFGEDLWTDLFPKANGSCFLKSTPYSYKEFIKAVRRFPDFASGTITEQKKELAALFGMSVQEIGGKPLMNGGNINFPGLTKTSNGGFSEATWDATPSYQWGMFKSCEDDSGRSTTYDIDYPGLKPGQMYFAGSGILQLTYPANFARFSEYFFGDKEVLLSNSDLVRTDGDLAIGSGIFYWMSQADNRPSPHCCFTGKDINQKDQTCFERIIAKGYKKGFAMAICAVNGIECAIPADYRVGTRVNGYFGYGRKFGLTDAQLLEDCFMETADMPGNLNLV